VELYLDRLIPRTLLLLCQRSLFYKSNPKAMMLVFVVLVRGAKPGKNVQLLDTEIRSLCMKSREIFLNQPVLLELEAPIKIWGRPS